ncbi:MAG: LCP family protein, partial [Actinomycetota bacterium]|nr:LCP family protein [Actinomycetota bacterium]
ILTGIVLLVTANLVVGGMVIYVKWRLGQIGRVDVDGLSEDTDSVMNVLLVGSDSRDRLTGDAAAQAGKDEVSGQRSDTIMVLHIDSKQKKAAILSVPRDLYLPIAGTNRSDRVNTAFSLAGPTGLANTIQNGLGIKINHFAEVDFVGFSQIVDAVGGIDIYVPAPARDAFSGLQIGQPGCTSLDGVAALAWVRSRHYEYLSGGKWVADPRGDLGRIQRQQDFMKRMMKKAVASGLKNPVRLNRLIGIGVKNVTLDKGMSTKDITKLAKRFNSLDPEKVETLTVPGEVAMINGASVIRLNKGEAKGIVDRLNGIAPPPPPDPEPAKETPPTTVVAPGEVDVRVLNGNGTPGAAAKTADELKSFGYRVSDTGDAGSDYTKTTIRHPSGDDDAARQLRDALNTGAKLEEDESLTTADAVLILGKDYTGFRAGVAPAAPTSTILPSPVPKEAPPPTC